MPTKSKRRKSVIIHARATMARMIRIHQAISSGRFPNATTLSKDLDVSPKTIQRDLIFMRDQLQLPWEYEEIEHGYFYSGKVAAFPNLQINEGELFALVLAEKALQQYRGTPFETALESAFEKLAATLPDTISLSWGRWDQTISFRTSSEPVLDLKIFGQLSKAASGRQQLQLHYRKPGAREMELRTVDPYHLANVDGEWFLFAYCHLRKDIRTFVPSRIKKVIVTGKSFERPPQFSLEKRLRDSFGVHSGKGNHHVVIRFDETSADYVREKKWHPSQKLKELKDGGVELHLDLSSLAEIERWVLAWGGKAAVLQPPELITSVKASAKALLASV